MPRISLHQLTVADVHSVAELISIAARTGYDAVDLFVEVRAGLRVCPAMIESARELQRVRDLLRTTGIRVHNIESFPLTATFDFENFRRKLAFGASLGTERATVLLVDAEVSRCEDHFARASAIAGEFGLELGVEAVPISVFKSIGQIAGFIAGTGVANARCVVDLLHAHRNGDTPDSVAAVAPELIGSVQVMDAPAELPDEPSGADYMTRRMHEALEQRLYPGEGDLPLGAFLNVIPIDATLSLEVPHKLERCTGAGPDERAARALASLRRILRSSALPTWMT